MAISSHAALQCIPSTKNSAPYGLRVGCKRGTTIAATAASDGNAIEATYTRRYVLTSAAALVVLLPASASLAESRTQLFGNYYEKTEALHEAIQKVLDLNPDSEDYKAQISQFRNAANQWTGDYRRTMSLGRKSFAETTSAVSTLTGFYTTRGPEGGQLSTKVRAQAEAKLAAAITALKREKVKSGDSPEKAPTTTGRQ